MPSHGASTRPPIFDMTNPHDAARMRAAPAQKNRHAQPKNTVRS